MKKLHALPIKAFTPSDGFIKRFQRLIKDEVIPYQYEVLSDRAEGAEKSHVVQNFINAAKALRGEENDGFYGQVFQDSDAAKWLEAVAYSLVIFPDEKLEALADDLIEKIAAAQDEDGYLNTRFTISDRDKRWTNLLEGHELYCAGHFMEAAAAYYDATGKDRLLNVMLKNAEHIYKHFVTEDRDGFPGHPEVELALLKLYRATGSAHCLELAKRFIDRRGASDFFRREREAAGWTVWGNDPDNGAYQQSFAPVREQRDAVGHAVRAVYLYTGMADLAAQTDDSALLEACRALWESITSRRMYVTGGIGSTVIGEAFTVDYDLPNDTAYAETCASCGLMFFAARMLENDPDSRYANVMERAFYNTVLAGMQLDGKRFFYVNPLEVIPGISGVAATHWHDRPQRPAWFACACCPPNVARTVSGFGMYAYGAGGGTAFCHLYAAGTADFGNGMKISCETQFPYGFTVDYAVLEGAGTLAVRLPDWSEKTAFSLNGAEISPRVEKGYAYIGVKRGDRITLTLDGAPHFVYASPRVSEDTGCAAIQRGALVYCFEGADNGSVLPLFLDDSAQPAAAEPVEALGGAVAIKAQGYRMQDTGALYSAKKPALTPETITAVPYYTWGNRGENEMRVWLPVK